MLREKWLLDCHYGIHYKHHVHHYMCTGNLPNPTDSAYYPTLDEI